ncbi:hypothetical protein LCGC14_1038520 [marine sediment metagenome]|uniref:Uncharacterized protein n=1 Tax=marine sediment metagenome TaxID=412755 RepID=A0A0F9QYL0_9ZZZZ
MRKNVKKAGLILVIVVGILLSTTIISVIGKPNKKAKKPKYEPIPNRSKPIENHRFSINETYPIHILGNYTLSPNEIYFYDSVYMDERPNYANPPYKNPTVHIIQDIWFNTWIETGGTYEGGVGVFYRAGGVGQFKWTPPFLANWIIVNSVPIGILEFNWDWIIYDSIYTVDNTNNIIVDRSKPVEGHYFNLNEINPVHILGNYTISPNEIYFYDAVHIQQPIPPYLPYPRVLIIQDIWFNIWVETGGMGGVYDEGVGGSFYSGGSDQDFMWTPPFLANWIIINYIPVGYFDIVINDFIIYDAIQTTNLK